MDTNERLLAAVNQLATDLLVIEQRMNPTMLAAAPPTGDDYNDLYGAVSRCLNTAGLIRIDSGTPRIMPDGIYPEDLEERHDTTFYQCYVVAYRSLNATLTKLANLSVWFSGSVNSETDRYFLTIKNEGRSLQQLLGLDVKR